MQTSSLMTITYRHLSLDEVLANPDWVLRDCTVVREGNFYLKTIQPSREPPVQEVPATSNEADEYSPATTSPESTVTPALVLVSTQDLISARIDEHGHAFPVISREAVSNYTILHTSGRPAEIPTPHVNKSLLEVPEYLALATKETIINVLRIHILPEVGTTADKLVILACPLCGYCSSEPGRVGATRLRKHLETHEEFRRFLYECSKQHGP